VNTKCL